jgi:hypothetical protein
MRGGSLGGLALEHKPHHPVSERKSPGLPHRGHGCLAASAVARRRHSRQRTASRARTGPPHCEQRREHSRHRPVSVFRTRSLPQSGQGAFAASWRIRRMHRQQYSRPR